MPLPSTKKNTYFSHKTAKTQAATHVTPCISKHASCDIIYSTMTKVLDRDRLTRPCHCLIFFNKISCSKCSPAFNFRLKPDKSLGNSSELKKTGKNSRENWRFKRKHTIHQSYRAINNTTRMFSNVIARHTLNYTPYVVCWSSTASNNSTSVPQTSSRECRFVSTKFSDRRV